MSADEAACALIAIDARRFLNEEGLKGGMSEEIM